MKLNNRLGQYLIAILIVLYCTTNVVYALTPAQEERVRNATVFIETENGIGTGFYISQQHIVTCLHLVAGEENVTIESEDGTNLEFYRIRAYDAKYNLAILQVEQSGKNYLNVSTDPVMGEQIHAAGYDENGILRVKPSRIERHSYKDFCHTGIRFPITISSDGGPVLDIHGNVKGIFFIGLIEVPPEVMELNYSFVVPVSKLNKLLSLRKKWNYTLPKSVTLKVDHCKLIRQGNAKLRKSKWLDKSGKYNAALHYNRLGESSVRNGLNEFLHKRKTPIKKIIKY